MYFQWAIYEDKIHKIKIDFLYSDEFCQKHAQLNFVLEANIVDNNEQWEGRQRDENKTLNSLLKRNARAWLRAKWCSCFGETCANDLNRRPLWLGNTIWVCVITPNLMTANQLQTQQRKRQVPKLALTYKTDLIHLEHRHAIFCRQNYLYRPSTAIRVYVFDIL